MALVAIGVVDFLVYRSSDLYWKARGIADPEMKIRTLQKADKIFPWNDLVCYELGKAHFGLGMQGLNEGQDAGFHVRESVKNLERGIRINPASPFGHFYYAQSLQYENLLTQSPSDRIFAEFYNAAKLAGENREILFDVGKRLLIHWKVLKEEERNFVREILVTALQWKPVDKYPALLNLWHLNVGDVGVMESIMPEDPRIYRMFGSYLGEKSMCLEDRHRILSRADHLEFAIQKNLLTAGDRELGRSNWNEANKFFRWCLGNLPKIRFFHKISGQYPLVDSEFQRVYACANLGLARSILESGGGVEDARKYLLAYLEIENDGNSLKDFESTLVRNKISDINILLLLYHKQGYYQEVVDTMGKMQSQALSAKSLYIIGNASQKVGKQQDAAVYFDRSLGMDAKNLKTLLPIRQFYQNSNNKDEILQIDDMIDKAVASKQRNFSDLVINKQKEYSWQFSFDGKDINIDLYFKRTYADQMPLITIEFNREVVWDDFLEEERLSVPVKTVVGKNNLRISAVNHPVILKKISYNDR